MIVYKAGGKATRALPGGQRGIILLDDVKDNGSGGGLSLSDPIGMCNEGGAAASGHDEPEYHDDEDKLPQSSGTSSTRKGGG